MLHFLVLTLLLALPGVRAVIKLRPVWWSDEWMVDYRHMRLPMKDDPSLCLSLPSFDVWGEEIALASCDHDSTRLVMRSDNLVGFGNMTYSPVCLDVTFANVEAYAQGWGCWGTNTNQKFEWLDKGAYQRLRWMGSNHCLTVDGPMQWSSGHMTGGVRAGVKVRWAPCDANNSRQRWGWINLDPW